MRHASGIEPPYRRPKVPDFGRFDRPAGQREALYGLPHEALFCKQCEISDQRFNAAIEFPAMRNNRNATIHFDDDWVCGARRLTEKQGCLVAVPRTASDGEPHPISHIGWSPVLPAGENIDWIGTMLDGVTAGLTVYFVHSFMTVPNDPCRRIAECDYDGERVTATIWCDDIIGCQLHPEKNTETDLRIVRNFLS